MTNNDCGVDQTEPSDRRDRRASRERKLAKVRLICRRYGVTDAVISDVSCKGARIRTEFEMRVYDLVWLRFRENDPVHAMICWKNGRSMGLRFADYFDTSDLVLDHNYLPEGVYRENSRYAAFERFKVAEAEQRPAHNWKIAAV